MTAERVFGRFTPAWCLPDCSVRLRTNSSGQRFCLEHRRSRAVVHLGTDKPSRGVGSGERTACVRLAGVVPASFRENSDPSSTTRRPGCGRASAPGSNAPQPAISSPPTRPAATPMCVPGMCYRVGKRSLHGYVRCSSSAISGLRAAALPPGASGSFIAAPTSLTASSDLSSAVCAAPQTALIFRRHSWCASLT